jgi:hypothetical protein
MGGPAETVEGPTLDGVPLADVVQLARATRVTVIDRGNRARTLAWKVRRAAAASAVQALRNGIAEELAVELASGGIVAVNYGMPGGIVLGFLDGALTHQVAHSGRMALHDYHLSGGQLTLADYTLLAGWPAVTPPGASAQLYLTGGDTWLQLYDLGATAWRSVCLVASVLTCTAPGVATAVRINGGYLQLWDNTSAGFRPLSWNGAALTVGAVDGSATDGNPATAARLYTDGTGCSLQLLDTATAGQFRSLILTAGVLTAGAPVN